MIAIRNAKVVLEHGILFDGVILVENDRIITLGKSGEVEIPSCAQTVDAKGAYVGPGFVDIHVHGGNRHFFYAEPEEAAEYFLSHGETTVMATLYYDLSKEDFLESIGRVKTAMQSDGPGKAIGGFYMEGPYMNPKYGASPEKNKWRGEIRREDYADILAEAGELARVWAVAPERDGIEAFVKDAKATNPAAVFSVGHSEATPEQIRKLKKYGLCLQTHSLNATGRSNETMAGVRGCGPDEACLADHEMYAELISDSQGIHVHPDMQRLMVEIKGVDRLILISDSFVSEAESPDYLRHIKDLVYDDNGYLSGSKLTMDMACKNIMSHTSVGICQAFLMASRNPARVLGMDDEIGTVEPGKKANLVFVDDQFHVQKVMLEGVFRRAFVEKE